MNRDEIRAVVLAALQSVAPEADVGAIPSDRPLREEIDLDSMDWLNVMALLQEKLSLEIPASDQARLSTIAAILDYAEARGAALAESVPRPGAAPRPPLPSGEHLVRGTRVTVRPLGDDDKALEADFVRHLSSESRYNRFMVAMSELPAGKLDELTHVDQQGHVALVATVQQDERPVQVGVARYIVDAAGTGCEFAIAVDDAWQGSGLAGILMHALIDIARARGLARMEGLVLRSNEKMLRFTRQLGFVRERGADDHDTVCMVLRL